MSTRSLGYATDIALLTYGGSTVTPRADYRVVCSPHNPTFWGGNFILLDDAPVPGSAPHWLETFHAEFPDAEHVTIGVDATGDLGEALADFSTFGVPVDAMTVMTATSVHAPPRVADAAVCRALSSDDDWERSVDLDCRSNVEEHEPNAYRTFATRRRDTHRRLVENGRGQWFGAFVDGELLCQMGLFRAPDGLARFQNVHTDPAARRHGLAATLVHHVSRYGFDHMGASTLVMVADPGYFAIDLYRSVGFSDTESQWSAQRGPLTTTSES